MSEIEKNRITEICELHNEIYESILDKGIRIGQLLSEQKTSLKHGEFIPWVKANLPFTERTAQFYMKIYTNRERIKNENVSHLTEAYKLLEAPKPRGHFIEIDSRDIEPNPFFKNSFLIPESIKKWTITIEHIGLYWITAVRLNQNKYQNICDHNRLMAIKMLEIKKVPAVIVSGMNDEKMKSAIKEIDYKEFHKYELHKKQEQDR